VGTKNYQPTANNLLNHHKTNEAIYHNSINLQFSLNPELNNRKIKKLIKSSYKPKLKLKTNKSAII
jgi:hypothetical protein